MSEEVIGYVRAIMTRGWKGDLHCTLVFTTQRIIVAIQRMLFQVASGFGGAGALGGAAGGYVNEATGHYEPIETTLPSKNPEFE